MNFKLAAKLEREWIITNLMVYLLLNSNQEALRYFGSNLLPSCKQILGSTMFKWHQSTRFPAWFHFQSYFLAFNKHIYIIYINQSINQIISHLIWNLISALVFISCWEADSSTAPHLQWLCHAAGGLIFIEITMFILPMRWNITTRPSFVAFATTNRESF